MPSPEFDTLLTMLRASPPRTDAPIEDRRAGFEQLAALLPLPDDARVEAFDIGSLPAEWISIKGARSATTVVFLHGGGYTIGSLNTHRRLSADISRAAHARVLAIDYRLAPEHPHPAAVDDATAAYRWLLAQGVAPERTIIAGDSAGGGLTAAMLLALRDAADPLPAAAVLLSPWLDLTLSGDSMTTKASLDPILTVQDLKTWASMYTNGMDRRTPLASPLYAELSGLPPLLVQVGTAEVLLDDSTRFAERARAAGVDVTLDVWDDMVHIWHIFAPMLPEGGQAIDRIGAFIKERVAVHA